MKTRILVPFLLIYFLLLSSAVYTTNTDSLVQLLPIKKGKEKALLLCDLCYEVKYQDALKARDYCQQALDLSRSIDFEKGEAQALQYLGVTYEGQGDFETALRYQEDALPLFRQLLDTIEIANTLNNMGIVLDQKGDYQSSLENYFQALELYEILEYKPGIARALNNIGIVYKDQGDYEKVIEYYQRSLKIYEDLKHDFGIAATKSNIGAVYLKTKDYDSAIQYSEMALTDLEALQNYQFMPYALENIGLAYGHQNNLEQSQKYHQEALLLYQKYGNKKESAYTLNSLANISFKQKNYSAAKKISLQSLTLAQSLGAKEEIRNAHLLLSKVFEAQGNYQKAYDYHKAYVSVKDTLFEIEKTERIAELETRYESTKKEKENLQLRTANEINELTISKKQNQLLALGIGSVLLLLIGGLWYRQGRLKQREVLIKRELEFKEQAIQIGIQGQEQERKRIAKDLHDGIGQQLTGLKMAWQRIGTQLSEEDLLKQGEFKQLTTILDDATTDVRNISHMMMPRALQELGLIPALEDMLRKSFVNRPEINYDFSHYKTKQRYAETIEVAVYRIAQELVNNILKHAKANEVEIQLIENNQHLILNIEDNGRGFEKKQLEHKGHGIMNIESRARAINGQINFESDPGEGTLVTLRIPLG